MTKRLQIKSNYQLIRLWFEFYKLALKEDRISLNFDKTKDYYQPWGDITDIKFDDWYKSHSHLFLLKISEITRVSKNKNVLNVSIPLSQTVTESLRQLKELLIEKQSENRPNSYEFTKGIKINGKTLYEIQLIYTIWLDLNKPPINSKFIYEVVTRLRNRPRAKWVPYIVQIQPKKLRDGSFEYSDEQIRQMRRYIKKAEKICQSVSLGQFPGKSSLS